MRRSIGSRSVIYDSLKEEIVNCIILPEQILVVDKLAERFSVSRTPVREALLALCNEGLLTARHRVGFIVSRVDPRDIIETYSLRILLEKEAVRLAADRITPEALAELGTLAQKPLRQQGRRFHSLIAEASCWGVVAETLEWLLDKSARSHAILSQVQVRVPDNEFYSIHGHKLIYDAICARDVEKAVFTMEQHLNEARKRVLRAIDMI